MKVFISNEEKYLIALKDVISNNTELLANDKIKEIFEGILKITLKNELFSGKLFDQVEINLLNLQYSNKNLTKQEKEILNYTKMILIEKGYICGLYNQFVGKREEYARNLLDETHNLKMYLSNYTMVDYRFNYIYKELVNIESPASNVSTFGEKIDLIEKNFFALNDKTPKTLTEEDMLLNIEKYLKYIKFVCSNEYVANSVFYNQNRSRYNNTYGIAGNETINKTYNNYDNDHNNNFYNGFNSSKPTTSNTTSNQWFQNDFNNSNVCNPSDCKGCCINGKCVPEEECISLFLTGSILFMFLFFFGTCCCCVCIIWAIVFLIIRMRRRHHGLNNNLIVPVNGIPLNMNNSAINNTANQGYDRLNTNNSENNSININN